MTSYYSKLWNMEFNEGNFLRLNWYSQLYEAIIVNIQRRNMVDSKYSIFVEFYKHNNMKFENKILYSASIFENKYIIPTILNRKHNEIIEIEDEEYNKLFI